MSSEQETDNPEEERRVKASEVTVKKRTQDGIAVHAGWNISPYVVEWRDRTNHASRGGGGGGGQEQYEEEVYLQLASKLAGPSTGIQIRREAIATMFKENKTIVKNNLQRRLFNTQRPTPQQIESRGIVPQGYFDQGHEKAIHRHHRRMSSTVGHMNVMWQMRPKPEAIVQKGVVELEELSQVYEVKDESDEDIMVKNKRNANANTNTNTNINRNNTQGNAQLNEQTPTTPFHTQRRGDANDIFKKEGPWEISLTRSLLFSTIHEALKKSLLQTGSAEQGIFDVMQEIADHIKRLRDVLDQFGVQKVSEQDEFRVRDQFQELQMKLLGITNRQQKVHEKLQILQKVERDLTEVQNEYNHKLGKMRRAEETILERLQRTKAAKDRAERIKYAEHSHRNWAFTKLDFTVNMTESQTEFLHKKLQKTSPEDANVKRELDCHEQFSSDLKNFLKELKSLTERQQSIVKDYENSIENMESDLIRIRHEMSKIRQTTFAKIYEFHKHVEIADALDLGHRRVSVANATEIDRERRHHATKIQRQLTTLQSQLKEVDIESYSNRLEEMIDLQMIMSDHKLKAFFSVFVQSFSQTLIDIDLLHRQMNSNSSNVEDAEIENTLTNFYGINNILETIDSEVSGTLELKMRKTMHFIKTLQDAIIYEQNEFLLQKCGEQIQRNPNRTPNPYEEEEQKIYERYNEMRANIKVKIEHLTLIILFVGRKLTCDEQMQEEIDETEQMQVPRLAEMRCRDVFKAIANDEPIFDTQPHSILEAAQSILQNVWRIEVRPED